MSLSGVEEVKRNYNLIKTPNIEIDENEGPLFPINILEGGGYCGSWCKILHDKIRRVYHGVKCSSVGIGRRATSRKVWGLGSHVQNITTSTGI